ncbi:hypothetical protein DYH10_01010 [Candidatus Saccharibacteria bacterium CPR2]|nr:hypothetical protein [Candidatus Saccharibacteria bacterium CPR2]
MSKIILPLYVLTTSFGLVLLKLGSADGLPIKYLNSKLQFNINLYTIAGIVLYGISFLLYMYLISKNDLGYIIPVTASFVYVLIFVASYFIFHEVFTALKIVGISLIVIGLVFLNYSRK